MINSPEMTDDSHHKSLSGRKKRHCWLRFAKLLLVFLIVNPAWAGEPLDAPLPGDDATYRPTVLVRKGPALGTGTIIASVEGETLILTASHVVDDPGPLHVELFRYNFGWEQSRSVSGFPRKLAAAVVVQDRDADLAILRVRGQLALPYVVRIAPASRTLPVGSPVTSIGFDHGERLIGFPSRVRRIDRIDMSRGGGDRPFLITDHPPEIGRSGGGLFLENGMLVGVCVARAQLKPGPVVGMYSPVESVWNLLNAHQNLMTVVSRSKPVVAAASPTEKSAQQVRVPRVDRTGDRSRAN